MEKAVRSPQIDERAEIRHILDRALHDIPYFDALEQLLLHLCFSLKQDLLPVPDNPPPARVELRDDKLNLLVLVLAQILLVRIGNEARGDEHPRLVKKYAKAAIQYLVHLSSQDLPIMERLLQPLIAPLGR